MPIFIKKLYQKIILKVDGGEIYSNKIRELYKNVYGIDIGKYTYGCFDFLKIAPNIKIGNFCSFAQNVRIVPRREHPMEYISTHPFFFNSVLGIVDNQRIPFNTLEIGNDVWIGEGAIITSKCSKIGNGAVIGAGSIVNKDVPPYAVVAGVPAKIIRYRFDDKTILKIQQSKWFDLDISTIRKYIAYFDSPSEFCDVVINER
jgi:acetyltransferase-like isoleucine patch superfamily enzyme